MGDSPGSPGRRGHKSPRGGLRPGRDPVDEPTIAGRTTRVAPHDEAETRGGRPRALPHRLGRDTQCIIVHKAIVTNIQVEELPVDTTIESAEAQGVELAPTGNLLVTIAAEAAYIEKIVFTAEWGSVWLAIEGELAAEEFDQVQTRILVYREIRNIDDLVPR